MVKPVVYLDVDGVLNAVCWRDAGPQDTWDDFVFHPKVTPDSDFYINGESFDLWLSKKMVAELVALDMDVVWLTTWRECAPKTIAPLVGAPEWPHLEWYRSKVQAIIHDQHDNPRPFVWIDDDVADKAYLPPESEGVIHPNHLLIRPDTRVGITPGDIIRIRNWMGGLKDVQELRVQ